MRIAAARLWNQPPLAESALPKKYGPKSRLAISRRASRGPCPVRPGASTLVVNAERPRLRPRRHARLREHDGRVIARRERLDRPAPQLPGERRCPGVGNAGRAAVQPEEHPLDVVSGLRLGPDVGAVAGRAERPRAQPCDHEAVELDPPRPALVP